MGLVRFLADKSVHCMLIEGCTREIISLQLDQSMRQPKEVVMRRFFLTGFIFGVLVSNAAGSAWLATLPPPAKTIAVTEIQERTRLLRAELMGKYIFVHDDSKMSKGEPCLYVYRYEQDAEGNPQIKPENLVVSFHCQRVERPAVTQLVMTYGVANDGSSELREIQFAGTSEGHRVP